jgi:hypothetical protein
MSGLGDFSLQSDTVGIETPSPPAGPRLFSPLDLAREGLTPVIVAKLHCP